MSNIVGIDLGTTMSAIAFLNSVGKPEIIPNKEGDRITPSVIFFESDKKLLIGDEAKNQAGTDIKLVTREFKRKMHDESYSFSANNKTYSATDLSSLILKKLVQDASVQVGEIKDVVISVPAYFKENQRNATIQAGQLAGLNVIAIINEPTAAALFYASNSKISGKGLVYDLGGGTFDVTVTDTTGDDVKIVASAGDPHLGGIDFDQIILELMSQKFESATGSKLCSDDESTYEFTLQAEDIKKSLSSKNIVKRKLRTDDGSALIEISQNEFEEKISTYISRTELLVEQALDESNCEASDIDYILLVGGSTRIPAIKKSIKSLMNKEPITAVNVDEAVALGAAIKAGLVTVKENMHNISSTVVREMKKLDVTDVANYSYGTISLSFHDQLDKYKNKNSIIIEKNMSLPCSKSNTFYTTHQGQSVVNIEITQGEGDDPDFVDIIDTFTLDLPEDREEGCPIEVTYSYDENQIMHCNAKDINSGIEKSKKINFTVDTNKKVTLDSFLID